MLSDHLNKVSCIAGKNARYFGAVMLAKNAGGLHDIGKYTDEFQKRLEGGKRVDHATAEAKIAVQKWGHFGKLLAYIIVEHHAGLANGIDSGENKSTLNDRLKKTIPKLDNIWKEDSEVLIFTTPEWKAPPEIDQYAASMRHILHNHVWIKT